MQPMPDAKTQHSLNHQCNLPVHILASEICVSKHLIMDYAHCETRIIPIVKLEHTSTAKL